MNKIALTALAVAVALGLGWAGVAYHRQSVCTGLEEDFLNAVSGMKRAAVTQPLAMRMGSNGDAHELAIKANARAMNYYLAQISEKCGGRASGVATRKAQEIVSD